MDDLTEDCNQSQIMWEIVAFLENLNFTIPYERLQLRIQTT